MHGEEAKYLRRVHKSTLWTNIHKVPKCILENKLKNKNRNDRMLQVVTRYLTYKNVFFEKI